MSLKSQSKAAQSLLRVLVSIFSFAFNLRMVLLSIPHFSRSVYVLKPFSLMVIQSLSNFIILSPPFVRIRQLYGFCKGAGNRHDFG